MVSLASESTTQDYRRKMMYGRGLALGVALLLGINIAPATAGYIVVLEQVGFNVVAIGSGALDLTGLSSAGSTSTGAEINAQSGLMISGPTLGTVDGYTTISGPTNFGIGSLIHTSTGTGDLVGVVGACCAPRILVPQGYLSDTALSDISIYNNQTLSSLAVTPGTYEWTWGTGVNQRFTLEVASVPEPNSMALLLSALVSLMGLGWLRSRQTQRPHGRSYFFQNPAAGQERIPWQSSGAE